MSSHVVNYISIETFCSKPHSGYIAQLTVFQAHPCMFVGDRYVQTYMWQTCMFYVTARYFLAYKRPNFTFAPYNKFVSS